MEEIRNIHLYQEISSYEDSSQGFCSLIHNLCFSPGQEEAELPNLGEDAEAEAEGRGSVIVRNGYHDLGDSRSQDSRAQAEERTQEKLPVLTYLGRPRGRDVSRNLDMYFTVCKALEYKQSIPLSPNVVHQTVSSSDKMLKMTLWYIFVCEADL